MNNEKTVIVY